MQLLGWVLIICLLIAAVSAGDNEEVRCEVEQYGSASVAFEGIVTREFSDGRSLEFQIERILDDVSRLFPPELKSLHAELPAPQCRQYYHLGIRLKWVGTAQWVDHTYKLIVRIYNPPLNIANDPHNVLDQLDVADPCAQKACHHGAICEVWRDETQKRIAVCTCQAPIDLESRGQCSLTSGGVCASDGNIYASQCHLLQSTCTRQITLAIVSWTAVNKADCQQLAKNNAIRVRDNEQSISLKVDQTDQDPNQFVQTMKRPTAIEPRHNEQPQQDAAAFVQEMSRQTQTFPDCFLSLSCSMDEVQPVCGSDGFTYLNPCLLKWKACIAKAENRPEISAAFCYSKPHDLTPAFCDSGNVCFYGARCVQDKSEDLEKRSDSQSHSKCSCEHINCLENSPYNQPACGNDGKTYSDACFLRKAVCTAQKPIKLLRPGKCGKNPCLEHACSWPGEQCRVDLQNRKSCVCPDYCPQVVVPVCGSDDITYDSVCHLQLVACRTRRHIWVAYAGVCLKSNNECERHGILCMSYEVCTRGRQTATGSLSEAQTPSAALLVPRCSCPFCPEDGLGGRVCGNDGRTYRSECHLRTTACHTGQSELKVKQRGTCDACQNMDCKFYSRCQTDEYGEPFCACPTNCLIIGQPVCGSNGRVYENECLLKVHSCAAQKEITVVDPKLCAQCSKPCPMGMKCLGGECVCRDSCPKSLEGEVCGTDGRLYPSTCELHRRACLQKTTIRIDGSGIGCRKAPKGFDELQADEIQENACGCNKIGSRNKFCDHNGRCQCHWGVEGHKCDRCAAGYFGIANGKACMSCSCNRFGAVSTSQCDPYTGQCKCKPGITGQLCSVCPGGEAVTSQGCAPSKEVELTVNSPITTPNRKQSSEGESGLFFSLSASALFAFDRMIEEPISIRLTMTPSALDGDITLLSLPTEHLSSFKFIRLQLSQGHVEASYIPNLYLAKVLILRCKTPVQLGHPMMINFTVTKPEYMELQVSTARLNNILVESSERLLHSQEYNQINNRRYDGLALGCPSSRSPSHQNCGFSGCLTALDVEFMERGQPIRVNLVINGQADSLKWLQAPEGAAKCTAPSLSPGGSEGGSAGPAVHSQTVEPRFVHTPPVGSVRACSASENPCLNGGICQVDKNDAFLKCLCKPGWQRATCDEEATIIPEFNGTAFIRLKGPNGVFALRKRRFQLELLFLRKKEEGIILAIPPSQSNGAFLAVRAEADGCIRVYMRVGDIEKYSRMYYFKWLESKYGPKKRISVTKVCSIVDLQWHNLTISKTRRSMEIFLDGEQAANINIHPKGYRQANKELRKALISFDLLNSPIYLGGVPEHEGRLMEDVLPVKQAFVGAIQKVIVNGAELVLAGSRPPSENEQEDTEHWENVVQWQGAPCGPEFSPCRKESMRKICRPVGSEHYCSCATSLTHMELIRQLIGQDSMTILTVSEQHKIAQRAEEMACRRIQDEQVRENQAASKELQADFPTQSFSRTVKPPGIHTGADWSMNHSGEDSSLVYRTSIGFEGKTILRYPNMGHTKEINQDENNLRIRLRTTMKDGLIMLMRSGTTTDADPSSEEFFALAIRAGRPDVMLSLQRRQQPTTTTGQSTGLRRMLNLQATTYVADGEWHTIQVLRGKGQMSIIADNQMVGGELLQTDGVFNSDGNLWLGGSLKELKGLPAAYNTNFTGCVESVFIRERALHLLTYAEKIFGPVNPCV